MYLLCVFSACILNCTGRIKEISGVLADFGKFLIQTMATSIMVLILDGNLLSSAHEQMTV